MSLSTPQIQYLSMISVRLQATVGWHSITGVQLASHLLDALSRNHTVAGQNVTSLVSQSLQSSSPYNSSDTTSLLSDLTLLPSSRLQNILWPYIFITLLSTLFLLLRFTSRKFYTNGLKHDDHWLLAAYIPALATSLGFIINATKNSWPSHSWNQTYSQLQSSSTIVYWTTFTLTISTACVRTGMCHYYSSFIRHKYVKTRIILTITIIFTWISFSLSVAYYAAICQSWEVLQTPEVIFDGDYMPVAEAMVWSVNILNAVLDFGILVLPLPVVYRTLQVTAKERVGVTMLVALGVFTGVCAVMKCVAWRGSLGSNDLSWRTVDVSMWSLLEPHLGIICASVPPIRDMAHRFFHSDGERSEVGELESRKASSASTLTIVGFSVAGGGSGRRLSQKEVSGPEAC